MELRTTDLSQHLGIEEWIWGVTELNAQKSILSLIQVWVTGIFGAVHGELVSSTHLFATSWSTAFLAVLFKASGNL